MIEAETIPEPAVQPAPDLYRDHIAFRSLESKPLLQPAVFWMAACCAFAIANAPPARMAALISAALRRFPDGWITALFPLATDLQRTSEQIVRYLFVPVKELLFLTSLLLISYPLLRCIADQRGIWRRLKIEDTIVPSIVLFFLLCLIVFPYSYPDGLNSSPSGLAGHGERYAQMSTAPFQEGDPLFYKRLLKPAIAHFLHLDGRFLYYVFSLVCTYVLILLTLTFLENTYAGRRGHNPTAVPLPKARWLLYLSVMTSSFILTDFQWPGYSDQISFILVLLMALVPMTPQARLGMVILWMLNHDGVALALAPLILFCFPRTERMSAFVGFVVFYTIVAAGYGFNVRRGLLGEHSFNTEPVWEAVLSDPAFFMAALFFTYKLLWVVPALAAALLWKRQEHTAALAIAGITFLPVLLTIVAWDTTRVAGFGFFGLLLAFGILIPDWVGQPRFRRYAFVALMAVNIVIPSYTVVLAYRDSFERYPYPGLYMFMDSTGRALQRLF